MNRKKLFTTVALFAMALTLVGVAAGQAKKAAATDDNLMDLNSAPLERLMTLNGVDLMTAKKIAAGRPYTDKKQVVTKKIMTQEAFDRISRSVTAKPAAKGAATEPPKKGKKG